MRIAIVGAGVSGLVVAYLLHGEHEITLFEAADYAGGHVCTVDVERGGRNYAVDTGFIVHNRERYPAFCRLLDQLGVETIPTRMSFSLRDERTGAEFSASSLGALFAQPSRALSFGHWRFVRDLRRFSRQAARLLDEPPRDVEPELGEWLKAEGYGEELVERFAIPIGAAIWSTSAAGVRRFPARFFVQFLDNHRMLARQGQPVWHVVRGGSREYVRRLTAGFVDRIRLSTPVAGLRRETEHVLVRPRGGEPERFDQVVLAVHSNQALGLLEDPSPRERELLSAIGYQRNHAVLHTDARLLPQARRARACWNYHLLGRDDAPVAVTYDMNRLQRLDAPVSFCVTLNRSDAIDPRSVIRSFEYHHPSFSAAAVAAQRRHTEISGVGRTHYAGAYWGYGFHEDGVQSALAVARCFGKELA
jgi:predicted NAD/FAD-binding protein